MQNNFDDPDSEIKIRNMVETDAQIIRKLSILAS